MQAPPSADLAGTRPAATVIIVRQSPGGPEPGRLELMVIERARAMGFAGGAIAFPGGKLDPTDQPTGPAFAGFAGLDPVDAAARVAAAREAFEETGLLLSTGPALPAAERARLRLLSQSHAIGFADLLGKIGHRLDAGAFRPFARWLPPAGLPVRFDTRFYLARLARDDSHADSDGAADADAAGSGNAPSADGHEAVACHWARPTDLLAQADAGAISLLFPTRCNLARLAQFADVASLMSDPTPPPFVQPAVADGWLCIPDGIGYPHVRERLDQVRRS